MLTYRQVMTTELAQLATAAGRWDAMAEELKKVEGRYGDSVQKITTGPDWLGTSALAAHDSFAGTRYEYAAAQIQAKAIASLLRDAHEQFTDLKNRVESARDEAVKAGMTVSEAGRVAFDLSRLTPAESSAYHHDPDGQASVREAVTKWQPHEMLAGLDSRYVSESDPTDSPWETAGTYHLAVPSNVPSGGSLQRLSERRAGRRPGPAGIRGPAPG